jgi:hypothetical protein
MAAEAQQTHCLPFSQMASNQGPGPSSDIALTSTYGWRDTCLQTSLPRGCTLLVPNLFRSTTTLQKLCPEVFIGVYARFSA